jgi:hypothetical protein
MKEQELVSKEIANVIDILEQVKDVNKMIHLHQDDADNLMIDQYKYRKEKLLNMLKSSLYTFDILPTDLGA